MTIWAWVNLKTLSLIQIPHHGSRNNIAPSILDRIVGPITNQMRSMSAVVSAPKDDENHPRNIVVNAFIKRGVKVFTTQGKSWTRYNLINRHYSEATPMEFFTKVEVYD